MSASFGTCVLTFTAATVIACTGGERRQPGDTIQGVVESDTGGAMAGMRGMPGTGDEMMEQMQAHMGMMAGVSADSMRMLMSTHRQMVANMLSQMNREMRDMNMAGDAAWTATMDSVQQDLVRLPEMRGAQLREVMPAHRTRVMRLIDMHRAMMRNMMR